MVNIQFKGLHCGAPGNQRTGGKTTVNERILKIALAEMAVVPSAGDSKIRKASSAKVYQFPPRATAHPATRQLGDVKMADADAEFAHPSLIVEIAAAVLAFGAWLVWRLTQAFSSH
jgi:hypothetical protein